MSAVSLRLFTLFLFALAVTGCKVIDTIHEKQLGVDLENNLKKYQATVRWGRLADAYGFLEPEIAREVRIPDGLENIRVTQYRIIKPPTFRTPTMATQTVAISYILLDRQVERTLVDDQIWQRENEETRNWYRFNPIPELK